MPAGYFTKCVFGGPVSLSDDWSCGVWYHSEFIPLQPALDAMATALITGLHDNWWTGDHPWSDMNAAGTKLETVRCYSYVDGVLNAQSEASITPASGTGPHPHPAYVACCVTLKTDRFGRRYRGRIYLPATAGSVDTNAALFTTLSLESLQNLGNVLGLLGLGVDPPVAAVPVVVSQTGGVATPISHLRYDNKPDTQHGRENRTSPTSSAETPLLS
jgi:hypothetical protein